MIITYFRSSSYNTFSICQQQYFLNYCLGIPQVTGQKAEMGTIVHKVMECLAKAKESVQNGQKTIDDEHFGSMTIPKDLFDQHFVEYLLQLSFEHYSDPNRTAHTYDHTHFQFCKKSVHKVLNEEWFDPRKRDVIGVEPFFNIPIEEDWAHYDYDGVQGQLHIMGTIDLITRAKQNVGEVIDWKTGQCKDWATDTPKDFKKLCGDPQLRIYHLALAKLYPEIEHWAMSIHFINAGGAFTLSYGQDDIRKTLDMLRKRFTQIQKTTRPVLKSNTNKHWFCKYVCDYGKCVHPQDVEGRTICRFIKDELVSKGMDAVVDKYTHGNFDVNFYQNPGA